MCEKGRGGTLPYVLLILLQSVLYGFGNPLSKIDFQSITVLWCLGIRFSGGAPMIGVPGSVSRYTIKCVSG